MDSLLKEISLYKEELNYKFMDIILKFAHHLRKYDYAIPPSSLVELIKITDEFNVFILEDFYGISQSLFCKTQIEYISYKDLFYKFIKNYILEDIDELIDFERKRNGEKLKELKEKLENERQEFLEKLINEKKNLIENIVNGKNLSIKRHKKQYDKLEKNTLDKLKELIKQFDCDYIEDFLKLDLDNINKIIAVKNRFPIDELNIDLNEIMMKNLENEEFNEELNEFLIKASKSLTKFKDMFEEENLKFDQQIKSKNEEIDNQINITIKENNNYLNDIVKKLSTKDHRDNFKGKNAIQQIMDIKDKKISMLNNEEYTSLMTYIKLNASKFRTVLSRSLKQHKNKVFDYKTTIAKSVKFYGEPVKLYYKKPIVKKYKLICILDISGSVSKYIELLASFVYEINTVFNGGVSIFGFVSDLIDFSEVFKNEDLDAAIKNASGHRGYSNYYKALSDFEDNYLNKIDGNTIIMFFGDARNNKNETGTEILDKIKKRSRTIIWLNPEEKNKWGKADSLIYTYKSYTNQLHKVSEVKDLINFMENFSLMEKI